MFASIHVNRLRAVSRLIVLAAFCAVVAMPQAVSAKREIPVGLYNVNNQPMNSGGYVYAIRFVVDRDTTMHRFISGFNIEGADGVGGRSGYAEGSGGLIRARLVEVKPNGEPDLSRVLAEETVSATRRLRQSASAFGIDDTQLLYFDTGGVQIAAQRMYAMTYQNVDPDPASNWFSENSPTAKESEAGPNASNTLDPGAGGAVAGLDSREAVAWSTDGGASWSWGRHVGEGSMPGSYGGPAESDDGVRLPWYGWQSAPGVEPESNQPYYAYREAGSYTLRLDSVPRRTTLTEAGGYAPVGEHVGQVTVRNLTTGETARTGSLGSGLQRGALDHPLVVEAGDSYTISNSGTVLKAEGDSFIEASFGVGGRAWPFSTAGNGVDRAELFTLPHPWYPASGGARAAIASRRATSLRIARARLGVSSRRAVLRVVGRVTGLHGRAARVQLRVPKRHGGYSRRAARVRTDGRFTLRWRGKRPHGRRMRIRIAAPNIGVAARRTVVARPRGSRRAAVRHRR